MNRGPVFRARQRLVVAVLALVCGGPGVGADDGASSPVDALTDVEIDRFVAEPSALKECTTTLMRPAPIRFRASVKQYPHPREVVYLYRVLGFVPMEPRPEVNHRMFVTTPDGHIMPVYVAEPAVEPIRAGLAEGGRTVRFYGYPMYNNSKGPAIRVTRFGR
jgi:hypothetical protein